ncbi:hypothetical protein BDV34DRAFT_53175 [Aspergillus parasiticus]|uniref:Uncharacterized protein n=1 Tax=Aspergillus parasiticus TaxID=5067 RepID=A0A5N6DT97_ASPPA|nr:hypothetical protein BDV34DRAFT_53175 [Aspergillus parasiticus]
MTIKIIKIFLFCVFSVQVSPVSVFHQVKIHPLDDGRCRDHLEAEICITYVLFSGSSNSELCLDDTQSPIAARGVQSHTLPRLFHAPRLEKRPLNGEAGVFNVRQGCRCK